MKRSPSICCALILVLLVGHLVSGCGAVAWSDDWSFWRENIPAFTVTDTAFLRSDDYHELSDTPETLDYHPFAELVSALIHLIRVI